jgi:LacI family sucrose operon transcriptional repressor
LKNKKVTLADIAQHAGVSKATVSFVLNGHAEKHRITEDTVKKVLAVVEQFNYKPSLYARALKSNRTFTVGLVIPDLTNMGFATTAKYLESKCLAAGYQLLIASSDDDIEKEKRAVAALTERQVDLMMVASAMTDGEFYTALNKKIPVVLFDRYIDDCTLPSVITNGRSATQTVVQKMIGQDVQECYFLGGQMALSPSCDRFEGYLAAVKASGLEFQQSWVLHRDYQPETGYQLMKQCCEQLGRLPQALFSASYSILEGVLRYLVETNQLESNMLMATFDNYTVLDCLPLRVSSIEQDCEAIAANLFELMQRKLSQDSKEVEQRVVEAKLHFR